MKVKCKFCGEVLTLNPDSAQTRLDGTDPHEQLRSHLVKHPLAITVAARSAGRLIAMFCFTPDAADDVAWSKVAHKLTDGLLTLEPMIQ
jgi:hypothetical protein